MKIATYPQRKCRLPVSGQYQDGSCEIREWHFGPCADRAVPSSIGPREDWEAAHPDEVDKVRDLADPYQGGKP